MSKDYRHQNFDVELTNGKGNGKTENLGREDGGRLKNIRSMTHRDRSRKAKQTAKYAGFSH